MNPRLPLAGITDEFSPALEEALPAMQEIGMTGAELRVVDGKNILDLTDAELREAKHKIDDAGLAVISIASPLLKCVLPGGPAVESRFQQDVFAARHNFEDQPRLTDRAVEVAHLFKTRIIRVFSYWRTVDPQACRAAITEALGNLGQIARREELIIGLENEHACNVATAAETAALLERLPVPEIGLVWDPANAFVSGEVPFPDGYRLLPQQRIVHVHAKDCSMDGDTPVWGPLGTRHVLWREQIAQLIDDGYRGFLSLETHWTGPGGNKREASRICGWNLRGLAAG